MMTPMCIKNFTKKPCILLKSPSPSHQAHSSEYFVVFVMLQIHPSSNLNFWFFAPFTGQINELQIQSTQRKKKKHKRKRIEATLYCISFIITLLLLFDVVNSFFF